MEQRLRTLGKGFVIHLPMPLTSPEAWVLKANRKKNLSIPTKFEFLIMSTFIFRKIQIYLFLGVLYFKHREPVEVPLLVDIWAQREVIARKHLTFFSAVNLCARPWGPGHSGHLAKSLSPWFTIYLHKASSHSLCGSKKQKLHRDWYSNRKISFQ